jgi:lysophospholipase L1-like esterase
MHMTRHHFRSILLAALLGAQFSLVQAAPAAAIDGVADRDYAIFGTLLKAVPAGTEREMGQGEYERARDEISLRIYAAAQAFYSEHPHDARRWEVVMAVAQHPPFFLKKTGTGAMAPDKAAWAAWNQQIHEWRDALIVSVDAPVWLREKFVWNKFRVDFWEGLARQRKGEPVDWTPFRSRFDAHVAAFAGEPAIVIGRAENYLSLLEEAMPGSSAAELQRFIHGSNTALRTYAAYRLSNPVPLNLKSLTGPDSPLRPTDRIVFLGDSITRNGADPGGFTTLIEQELAADSGHKATIINAGVGGDKVTDLGERLQRDVLVQHPTMVFVYIGINDVWHWKLSNNGTTKERFRAGLVDIIRRIQTAGANVVLATPSLIGEMPDEANEQDAMLDEYADISRAVARESGVTLCDLRQGFREFVQAHNNFGAEYGLLTEDGVHLTEDGNRLVANLAAKAITRALKDR